MESASVVEVQAMEQFVHPAIDQKISRGAREEYREIIKELTKLSSPLQHKRSDAKVKRIRSRFQEIASVDFFRSRCGRMWKNC